MTVEIICVGTEILLGNIVNTNAQYLARKCADMGLSMFYQTVVGDNEERLKEAIIHALNRSDVIITSGGLGPTNDDITKEMVAEVLGLSMYEDKESLDNMKEYFSKIGRKTINEINFKQALIPVGGFALKNNHGTAPGIFIDTNKTDAHEKYPDKYVFLLPGPPRELIPMTEEYVVPFIKEHNPYVIYSEMVKLTGIGESDAAAKINDLLINSTNPTVAPYAKMNEVHLRITAKATDEVAAKKLIGPVFEKINNIFGKYIYTTDETVSLEDAVVSLAKEKKLLICSAESCTGGLFASKIINVSGASDVFTEGFVTYSNEAKIRSLGVSLNTLKQFGAVSPECACEMALGALKATGSDVAISTTGIAGPTGGTKDKPVGLVYVGIADKDGVKSHELNIPGNRESVRNYATAIALNILWKYLKEN